GGLERLGQTARLFMVPGMYHCRGGPGADNFGGSSQSSWPGDPQRDMLWALIRWVEKGEAPDTLVATKVEEGDERFTRKLCAFPAALRFASDEDAIGECRKDPFLAQMMPKERTGT